jgi:hypothetical protein
VHPPASRKFLGDILSTTDGLCRQTKVVQRRQTGLGGYGSSEQQSVGSTVGQQPTKRQLFVKKKLIRKKVPFHSTTRNKQRQLFCGIPKKFALKKSEIIIRFTFNKAH